MKFTHLVALMVEI